MEWAEGCAKSIQRTRPACLRGTSHSCLLDLPMQPSCRNENDRSPRDWPRVTASADAFSPRLKICPATPHFFARVLSASITDHVPKFERNPFSLSKFCRRPPRECQEGSNRTSARSIDQQVACLGRLCGIGNRRTDQIGVHRDLAVWRPQRHRNDCHRVLPQLRLAP